MVDMNNPGIAISLLVRSWLMQAGGSEDTVSFQIQPQPLERALCEWARQTGVTVMIAPDASTALQAAGVKEALTAEAALQRLLKDSGLQYEFIHSRVVAIRSVSAKVTPAKSHTSDSCVEVIVTAQKREERLQDVPVPIEIISLDDCLSGFDEYELIGDLPNAILRSIAKAFAYSLSHLPIRTVRVHSPHKSVDVWFHVAQFRRLLRKSTCKASPTTSRRLSRGSARHRVARSSTSTGFSRVQRLVV